MPGRECYHCKQWIEEGEAHDCWTTTEAALTEDLSEELRDAWERLRESLAELGEQRIYASGSCIMFSRDVCYVFVRPKRKAARDVHLPRPRADRRRGCAAPIASRRSSSPTSCHIQHRDEVEPPLTDWLREAYALLDRLAAAKGTRAQGKAELKLRPTSARPRLKESKK